MNPQENRHPSLHEVEILFLAQARGERGHEEGEVAGGRGEGADGDVGGGGGERGEVGDEWVGIVLGLGDGVEEGGEGVGGGGELGDAGMGDGGFGWGGEGGGDGGEEERGGGGPEGGLFGFVAVCDRVEVEEGLPSSFGHETEGDEVGADLVRGGRRDVGGFGRVFVLFVVEEGSGDQALAVFAGRRGRDGVDDFVFADELFGNVGEQGAVVPDVDADAVRVRGCQVFAGFGEGESGARAFHAERVDQVAGWQIPHADDGVYGCCDDPTAVVGKAKVADLA